MSADRVEIIPRIQTPDPRFVTRTDPGSGVANFRMLVTLATPSFAVDFHGKDYAAAVADRVRERLGELYAQGKDARGRALPPLRKTTISRRMRRGQQLRRTGGTKHLGGKSGSSKSGGKLHERQRAEAARLDALRRPRVLGNDPFGALRDRFKGRGGKNRGKTYGPKNSTIPLNESGLFADNVQVRFKSTERGDPTFLIAIPGGGKSRGLVNDDGRGARQFAARHYGFERLMDIPPDLDEFINRTMAAHIDDVLRMGGEIINKFSRLAKKVEAVIEEGASGEVPED